MKYIIICISLFVPLYASAEPMEIHSKHWLFGYPKGTPATNDLIIRDSYALSSNDDTKLADWVAYRLTPLEVMGSLDLDRKWRADPWLQADETLEPGKKDDDYKGGNDGPLKLDRGHLAPLGSFKGSRYASQVNFYSNIVPQASSLNQGPWRDLEEKVRDYVRRGNTVWVLTGPLYEKDMDPLPNADEVHKVPSGFWKVVMAMEESELKVAAFLMPQEAERSDDIEIYKITVEQIEERSGLDLSGELAERGGFIEWLVD